eukprot:1575976-Pyramimonas_sp.AAC.1
MRTAAGVGMNEGVPLGGNAGEPRESITPFVSLANTSGFFGVDWMDIGEPPWIEAGGGDGTSTRPCLNTEGEADNGEGARSGRAGDGVLAGTAGAAMMRSSAGGLGVLGAVMSPSFQSPG